jgi:hypothetical protein
MAHLINWFFFFFLRIKIEYCFLLFFFAKEAFGKLFFKTIFEEKKWLKRLDNCFQRIFHLRIKQKTVWSF